MSNLKKEIGRIVAGSYYDSQEVRISTASRIRDVVRKRTEGLKFDEVEQKKKEKDYEKKYTDKQMFQKIQQLKEKGKITEEEYDYINKCLKIFEESKKIENKYKLAMNDFIIQEPVYTAFLSQIRGIGDVLSANLIKTFGNCEVMIFDKETKEMMGKESDDPKVFENAYKLHSDNPERYAMRGFPNVAKLWAYTGNHVVDGIAPKRKKNEKLRYNLKIKTMTWKISDCLIRSNNGFYRRKYDDTKKVLEKREYKEGELKEKYGKPYKQEDIKLTKKHIHNMASRKIRQLFLSHYWVASRELSNLPTRIPYVQEYLKHTTITTWKDAVKEEQKANKKQKLN